MHRALPLLLILLLAGGCSRMPKIIVLEDPLTAAEHVELGVAYERKGELDLAKREYERAIGKEKSHFRARVNLGNVFLAKKEYGQARAEYLLALDIRPKEAEAANNLAWCAIMSGEGTEEAIARMEDIVREPAGRRPEFLDTLGVLLLRANRPDAAGEALAEAETLCRKGDSCPDNVLREILEHRGDPSKRIPPPSRTPALIK